MCLHGDGDEGWLRYRRGEAESRRKDIHPQVVLPAQACRQGSRGVLEDEARIGELLGHDLAQRKQRLFQTDQEKGQPQQHVDETNEDPAKVGDGPTNDR